MTLNCPHCRTLTSWHDNPWRPFCSERCRLIDLGDWLTETHKIAGSPQPEPDDVD